ETGDRSQSSHQLYLRGAAFRGAALCDTERPHPPHRSAHGRARRVTSYRGRHAELYDLFYRDKPYADEAAFVHSRIAKWSSASARSVLELACGTGGHAFFLEGLGYSVTATDYSPDMVAQTRGKAAARRSSIEVSLQDMRALDLGARRFDVAVCLFDAIG